MNDNLTHKGWNKKVVYAIAIVIGLLFGIVGALSRNDEADGSLTPQERAAIAQADEELDSFLSTVQSVLQPKRICNQNYDYPGCTLEQMAALEAPDKPQMARNYDKARWGQSPSDEFDNLTSESNTRLRNLYNDAVERFTAARARQGLTGKAAAPRFATWAEFKANLDCVSVGPFALVVSAWCNVNKPINTVAENTTKMALFCDGLVVGATVSGMLFGSWTGTTVPAGAFAGGSAAIGCAVTYWWERVIPF